MTAGWLVGGSVGICMCSRRLSPDPPVQNRTGLGTGRLSARDGSRHGTALGTGRVSAQDGSGHGTGLGTGQISAQDGSRHRTGLGTGQISAQDGSQHRMGLGTGWVSARDGSRHGTGLGTGWVSAQDGSRHRMGLGTGRVSARDGSQHGTGLGMGWVSAQDGSRHRTGLGTGRISAQDGSQPRTGLSTGRVSAREGSRHGTGLSTGRVSGRLPAHPAPRRWDLPVPACCRCYLGRCRAPCCAPTARDTRPVISTPEQPAVENTALAALRLCLSLLPERGSRRLGWRQALLYASSHLASSDPKVSSLLPARFAAPHTQLRRGTGRVPTARRARLTALPRSTDASPPLRADAPRRAGSRHPPRRAAGAGVPCGSALGAQPRSPGCYKARGRLRLAACRTRVPLRPGFRMLAGLAGCRAHLAGRAAGGGC